jgi:flagellar motor switch protein FliM
MERRVVRIAADKVSSLLGEVWNDYVPLEMAVTGFESIPEMLRIANREDPVLVANLAVSARDMSSSLVLCLPFNALESFFTGTTARRPEEPQGTPAERRRDRDWIESTVRDTRIAVSARLPEFRASMGDLASLRPGDLLYTGLEPTTELELYVAGQRRFVAAPGRVGRNLATRVVDRVRPDPEHLIHDQREVPPAN